MSAYTALARHYDALTDNTQVIRRTDFCEKLWGKAQVKTVLDLACGTGALSMELYRRGYEVIGVDASSDMLAVAAQKAQGFQNPPMFLCQRMERLDLYGTVDAAVCALDALNYLTDFGDVLRTFERLRLFIRPGGMLVFDLNTREKFRAISGRSFTDEAEGLFCAWSALFSERTGLCDYVVDLFEREGPLWCRQTERHRERAYDPEEIKDALARSGFAPVRIYGDLKLRPPAEGEQRVYFAAVRRA